MKRDRGNPAGDDDRRSRGEGENTGAPPEPKTPEERFVHAVGALVYDPKYPNVEELAALQAQLKEVLGDEYDAYVEAHRQETLGEGGPRTRRGAQETAAVKAKTKYLADQDRRWFDAMKALAKQYKADREKRAAIGDGKLAVSFLHVGHGDCTLIRTPLGKMILIDCGNNGGLDLVGATNTPGGWQAVVDELRGFLKTSDEIELLIFTHSDQDHYNKIGTLLTEAGVRKIGRVYHSNDLGKYGTSNDSGDEADAKRKRTIKANEAARDLTGYDDARIRRVALNRSECALYYAGERITFPQGPAGIETRDADGSMVIHQETDCTVRILASEVGVSRKDMNTLGGRKALAVDSHVINGASVVVLVESFGKKILICGDATTGTEDFLVERYPARLANVDVVRVGHHGSNVTSSGVAFVDLLKAKKVIVSAPSVSPSHHFPAIEVLERFWRHATAGVAAHNLWYYVYSPEDVEGATKREQYTLKNLDSDARYDDATRNDYKTRDLWITGSWGAVIETYERAVG